MGKGEGRAGFDAQADAIKLAGSVYRQLQRWDYFTRESLGKQLYRAAISVASNSAEGQNRTDRQEFQFLGIALGSCQEAVAQLKIASSCGLLDRSTMRGLVVRYDRIAEIFKRQMAVIAAGGDNTMDGGIEAADAAIEAEAAAQYNSDQETAAQATAASDPFDEAGEG